MSVAVFESLAPDATKWDLIAACERQDLPAGDMKGLLSMFVFPIDWTPGAQSVTNGQHRSCALRAAGAQRCVVDTTGYPFYETASGAVESAASALLASHWIARLTVGSGVAPS